MGQRIRHTFLCNVSCLPIHKYMDLNNSIYFVNYYEDKLSSKDRKQSFDTDFLYFYHTLDLF